MTPQISDCALTTVKVVAVPKSTMVSGPSNSLRAPATLQTISDPSSVGSSARMRKPVRSPGPTVRMRTDVNRPSA